MKKANIVREILRYPNNIFEAKITLTNSNGEAITIDLYDIVVNGTDWENPSKFKSIADIKIEGIDFVRWFSISNEENAKKIIRKFMKIEK